MLMEKIYNKQYYIKELTLTVGFCCLLTNILFNVALRKHFYAKHYD